MSGVVVEDIGSGMLVVQLVVGEWMVEGSRPVAVDGVPHGPDAHE